MLNSWIDRTFALLFLALVAVSLLAVQQLQRVEAARGPEPASSAVERMATRGFPAGFERDAGYVEARLGFSAFVDGHLEQAVEHFSGAIQRSPDNPAWRFMMSDAYRARGDDRQARLEARRAQDLLRALEPARAAAIPH